MNVYLHDGGIARKEGKENRFIFSLFRICGAGGGSGDLPGGSGEGRVTLL